MSDLPRISKAELFGLVERRRDPVRHFLEWALENERRALEDDEAPSSMRMENRPDIRDAAEATELFAEQWWGVVVFTCFGSKLGTQTVAPYFQRPLAAAEASATLAGIDFLPGSVGHHRIQATLKGAKQALISACERDGFFHDVLHSDDDFDARYRRLREARIRQWGRTTCFDLLLRAGALCVGAKQYVPEFAYLAGSTGPKKGFAAVFGAPVGDNSAGWAEGVLRTWAEEWNAVARQVGVAWEGDPLHPRDQENFLCIYQERLSPTSSCATSTGRSTACL